MNAAITSTAATAASPATFVNPVNHPNFASASGS
jgi:hypothetical protein